jgi:hypothetical protein
LKYVKGEQDENFSEGYYALEMKKYKTVDPGIRMNAGWKKYFPSNLIVMWGSETIGRPRIRSAKWRCFSKRSKPYM